jgi:hypothetical protein
VPPYTGIVRPRWDTDTRGRGVASAAAGVPDLDRLREAMSAPDWVTEEPELHLLPHVRRLCEERGWTVARAEVLEAVLEVDVVIAGASRHEVQVTGFALVGTFAESSTHVVVGRRGEGVELVVTTGVLDGEAQFAAHGHVVRLRVAP